jgi:hypothetical protein
MTGEAGRGSASGVTPSRLRDLLRDPDRGEELAALLAANSNLPGPRGNLELADAFAKQAGDLGPGDGRWQLFQGWSRISAADAPTGDPREFLPFCALQAFGALYAMVDVEHRREIVAILRAAADDERWRTREGVAMAMQRIGEADMAALRAIVDAWLPAATLTGQRAIVAALAHPPILGDAETARYALAVADRIMANVQQADAAVRKSEGFRILRQALEYALSVYVAALPEEGFPRLRAWATDGDLDVQRIVHANLRKARLAKRYPSEVASIAG